MTSSVEDLLSWQPQQLLSWIASGAPFAAENTMNWLGLAEAAGSRALQAPAREARAWAAVTLAASRRAELFQNATHTDTAIRWLNLNAALISRTGDDGARVSLGPDELVMIFEEAVILSAAEVAALLDAIASPEPGAAPPSVRNMAILRRTKSLLAPMLLVTDAVEDPAVRAALQNWSAIYERLP